MWLQVINKVKVTHQGEGHINVKVKYLHPFKFYVVCILCKQVVCIRLKCYLLILCSVSSHKGTFEQQATFEPWFLSSTFRSFRQPNVLMNIIRFVLLLLFLLKLWNVIGHFLQREK